MNNRNLYILWFANFMVSSSLTMIMPFLSLFIHELGKNRAVGEFTKSEEQLWAGLVFGITFLVAFFVSSSWGRISDRFGYKPIMLLSGFGVATSIFLMGFVHSVEQLFALRIIMGLVTGFIPTSTAFIARNTPKEIVGKQLGTLQTGNVSGGLLGPLIGGLLADTVGFQYTFLITSSAILISTLTILFFLRENVSTADEQKKNVYSRKEVFHYILINPMLIGMMIITLLTQTANFLIQPLLALHVKDFFAVENVGFLAGLAFSASGIGNLFFTRQWGILGDRNGHDRILLYIFLAAGLLVLPQMFATSYWELVFFRFLYGMAIGGIIPLTTSFIRVVTPYAMQGEVFGYNVSFRFLGNVIGPIMGGVIAGSFTITFVFLMTSILYFIVLGLLYFLRKKYPLKQLQEE